jgi:hypothetical protein
LRASWISDLRAKKPSIAERLGKKPGALNIAGRLEREP